jgi:hypothetical protein
MRASIAKGGGKAIAVVPAHAGSLAKEQLALQASRLERAVTVAAASALWPATSPLLRAGARPQPARRRGEPAVVPSAGRQAVPATQDRSAHRARRRRRRAARGIAMANRPRAGGSSRW